MFPRLNSLYHHHFLSIISNNNIRIVPSRIKEIVNEVVIQVRKYNKTLPL